MKLILSGLPPDADLDALRERMSHFGPVLGIEVVREGDPERPWFVVEMGLSVADATEIARRIDGIYYKDRTLHARVMLHA